MDKSGCLRLGIEELGHFTNMGVTVIKHTDIEEAHACIESTIGKETLINSTLRDIYHWEHSITRSQIFSVQLEDIFTYVSTHLVRHVTTVPFVTTKRFDRGGKGDEGRYTPVNHRFIANAEDLLNMARRRLCFRPSMPTREAMKLVKMATRIIDPDLAYYMVPNCVYRGGICPEPKPCGMYHVRRFKGEELEKVMRVEEKWAEAV